MWYDSATYGWQVGVVVLAQQLYPGRDHAAEPPDEGGAADARGSDLGGQQLRRVEEEHRPGEGDAHLAHQRHGHRRPVVREHALVYVRLGAVHILSQLFFEVI